MTNTFMKQDWKKTEKGIYLPLQKPQLICIPPFKFFSITGHGDPNDEAFAEYIAVLYSLAYAVKMSPKKGIAPKDYYDYTVYPLEGVWDLKEEAKKATGHLFDKKDLVFNLMIRQPDFVTAEFAGEIIHVVKKKKPGELFEKAIFEIIEDGPSIQMLHAGPYDSEPESFNLMEAFALANGYKRPVHYHREIYLSDARKVAPEKLRTLLRFKVEKF